MRLEKIKLAGFKSFVDPTTVMLPSNLVGVIGPNGCGKSNVIDAVRWVMGETSAKMLRGESMADVIFNGSTSRKPVGSASIELVFDNADGSAGGQYAQYNQISVRRQVSRDGQSNYFLNGTKCRRRDITDLFLGTGLGPRSYSIIEQGMISRVIEAKPEELRSFFEEAAGISKYKERRRETENRMGHTRENLDRLNDLREEVAKQLQHLERQAATAEKFKELKQEERHKKAELLALRWRALEQDLEKRDRTIAEQETALEAAISKQRRLEADIEKERDAHAETNDRFNEIQGRFYAVGAEIARLEEAIQYARSSRSRQQADLDQAEQALQEAQDHREQDEARLAELSEQLAEQQPAHEAASEAEQITLDALEEAEQAMNQWQSDWEEFNQKAAEPAQTAQVERTRINHQEEQERHLQRRHERLQEERGRLESPQLDEEIRTLEEREVEQAGRVEGFQQRVDEALERIRSIREQNTQAADRLNDVRAELQTARGRLASLEALQQAALGKQQGEVAEWLEQSGLQAASRLAEGLTVNGPWQTAVETVLGFHLQAVCVDDMGTLQGRFAGLEQGSLTLFDTAARPAEAAVAGDALSRQVSASWPVANLMPGVRTAENLADALARRASLGAGESFITPAGEWLGPNWLRLNRGEEAGGGVLAREQEIRELGERVAQLEAQAEELDEQRAASRERLQEAEQSREQAQRELGEVNRQLAELRANLSGKRTRAEHLRSRTEALTREGEEILAQIEQGREAMEISRARLHEALADMESLGERRDALVHRRDELRSRLDHIRQEAQVKRQASHEIALRIESMRSSEQSLRQSLQRMSGQLEHLHRRREELTRSLSEGEAPLAEQQQELETKLAHRVEVENELKQARDHLQAVDNGLRELEQGRSQAEQGVQNARSRLEQSRMGRQEVLVRAKTLEEQFRETGENQQEVLQGLPEEASASVWQEEVERLGNRIARLGPINLAAIDEFKEQSERMEYLDRQHADVTESLETLENAIRKIDRETRTRFKETYDHVDRGLKELFPKLFGGGHAYLQLTGEDLLDSGVSVMARPPGKRNSSIHLLSGGEKALTAVALVFAIFQLNPAPFCMLDEVDAPLDDANVGRFCNLVKEMSDKVQFIFITHNKVTMEIANQLTGVTMHEPGVSRLVSVDIEEAAQMAAVS